VPRTPPPIAQVGAVMDARVEAVAAALACENDVSHGAEAAHVAVELSPVEPSHVAAPAAFG
jgi:hypothetical protein